MRNPESHHFIPSDCFAIVLVLFIAPTLVAADTVHVSSSGNDLRMPRLSTIIRMVEDNEKLYSNYEVAIKAAVRQIGKQILGPADMIPKELVATKRYIAQDAFYFAEGSGNGVASSGKVMDSVSTRGYDGEYTRVSYGNVFNFVHGRSHEYDSVLPHNLLAGSGMFAPLSLWLKGGENMRKHPGAQLGWNKVENTATCISVEDLHGKKCYKIKTECYSFDKGKIGSLVGVKYLWLPVERNLIPMKYQWYKSYRLDHPSQEGEVLDYLQLSEGIWYPRSIKKTYYDVWNSKDIPAPVDHTEEYTIESVNLDPKYPVEFFSDIHPKAGQVFYEVKDGKPIKSFVYGAVEKRQTRTYWTFAAVLVAGIFAVALYWYIRYRRRHTAPLPTAR